jgi:hypothetical protein
VYKQGGIQRGATIILKSTQKQQQTSKMLLPLGWHHLPLLAFSLLNKASFSYKTSTTTKLDGTESKETEISVNFGQTNFFVEYLLANVFVPVGRT